ncbi:MAG: hypothetical protein M3R64_03490 [Pseudomonadota bacterium]|nr:hypothetical protein [Pseudomonadota bacterium]
MLTALLSGAFALIGVALGGFSSHFLSLRREREARNHQITTQNRDLLRSKREELYSILAIWSTLLINNNLTFSGAMRGKITYDEANDIFIKNAERSEVKFERIDLLIDAYCPEVRPLYDIFLNIRSEINSIFFDFKNQYDKAGPYESYSQLKPYLSSGAKFEKAADHLKKEIVQRIREMD